MKMRFLLGLMLVTGLILVGCTKEDNKGSGGEFGGAKVELKLSNPTPKVAPNGAQKLSEPGDDTKNENTIDNIEIWVFRSNGTLSVYKNFTSPLANYKFAVPHAENNMKFLVCTNQAIGMVTTYAAAVNKIAEAPVYTTTTATADGNTRTVPERLVMTGWVTTNITPAASEATPPIPITIDIKRLVSKVEAPKEKAGGATLTIPETDLENLFARPGLVPTDVNFKMTGFTFINGLDKTSVFNYWNPAGIESDPWDDNWRSGKTYLASAFKTAPPAEVGHYEEVYGGSKDGEGLFIPTVPGTDVVYAYENTPVKDANDPDIYFDRTTVYSFIIKGELTDNASLPAPVSMVRYWKANLIPEDNYKILRNTIYRMEILGVSSVGNGTPKDAEEEVVPQKGNTSVQISINVANWNIKEAGTIL